MDFTVAIIGSGVSGASIARTISRYKVDTVILEKEADVAFGTSKANSGIIHGGFHHSPKYLKARLESKGNLMFDQLRRELDIPFQRCGILVAATSEEQLQQVEHLYQQGLENDAIGLEMCSRERMLELEPKLTHDVIGGLYAPGGGIVEPYRLVFALIESAVHNHAVLKTNFKVCAAEPLAEGGYKIHAADGRTVTAEYVINAAGLYADEISAIFKAEEFKIIPRKGQYYLLDRLSKAAPKRVIFPVPTAVSKGMLVIPTCEGTVLLGPDAIEQEDKSDLSTSRAELKAVLESAASMVPTVSERDIITAFSGLRPVMVGNSDFFIKISEKAKNFIQVAGIQSPGLTASPAIGEYVKDLLKEAGLTLVERPDYDPYLPKHKRIRQLSAEEAAALVEKDPAYGRIVCRCEKVSEAEIVEAIHHGHSTLDGIKFYTRAQMGRCQGGFCTSRIIDIICRETGLSPEEVTKKGPGSELIKGEL